MEQGPGPCSVASVVYVLPAGFPPVMSQHFECPHGKGECERSTLKGGGEAEVPEKRVAPFPEKQC